MSKISLGDVSIDRKDSTLNRILSGKKKIMHEKIATYTDNCVKLILNTCRRSLFFCFKPCVKKLVIVVVTFLFSQNRLFEKMVFF